MEINNNQENESEPGILNIPYSELELNKTLGSGGYGIVYSGSWRGRKIAVKKLIGLENREKEELLAEAKVFSLLNHRCIVPFIGVSTDPVSGDLVLVLDLAEEGSLDKLMCDSGALGMTKTIQIALDIADGILYLHSKNILHRDLKCENVLLYAVGDTMRAKLTDFGTAKVLSRSKASSVVGTLGYMAPEILKELKYSTPVDVYSFGAVLYKMLTNKSLPVPFDDVHVNKIIAENISDEAFC